MCWKHKAANICLSLSTTKEMIINNTTIRVNFSPVFPLDTLHSPFCNINWKDVTWKQIRGKYCQNWQHQWCSNGKEVWTGQRVSPLVCGGQHCFFPSWLVGNFLFMLGQRVATNYGSTPGRKRSSCPTGQHWGAYFTFHRRVFSHNISFR